MSKNLIKTDFKGVYLVKKKFFYDKRGHFFELFNTKEFRKYFKTSFVQDNISYSVKGTLRGLHFQKNNKQVKLLTVLKGSIFDVLVDLKKRHKKNWISFEIDEDSQYSLLIPDSYAHGFYAKKNSIIHYKVSSYYKPNSEVTIKWNDKKLSVDWPIKVTSPIISEKDNKGVPFHSV